MTSFVHVNNAIIIISIILFTTQHVPQLIPSPLMFTSDNNLLVIHENTIYCYDVATATLGVKFRVDARSDFRLDNIAFDDTDKAIWTTLRYGTLDSGIYHDFLIIPEDESPVRQWRSDSYWPTWNNCAQIYLAPHGKRILTLKAHQTSRFSYQEPYGSCKFFQQLALLPPDLDPNYEVRLPLNHDLDNFCHAEVSDDAATVLINEYQGKVFLWNPVTQNIKFLNNYLPSYLGQEYLHSGTLSPDGTWAFVAASTHGCLLFFKHDEVKITVPFGDGTATPLNGRIDRVTFSPDNKYLLIISGDQKQYAPRPYSLMLTPVFMLIFNLETLTPEHSFSYILASTGYPYEVCALASGGKTIAALSNQGVLRIIDAENQKVTFVQLTL